MILHLRAPSQKSDQYYRFGRTCDCAIMVGETNGTLNYCHQGAHALSLICKHHYKGFGIMYTKGDTIIRV